MTKQVKPQQIVNRIEALVKQQKEKGYKVGWVMFQVRELCEKKAAHVFAYKHDTYKSLHPEQVALKVAKGEYSLQDALEVFEESYQHYLNLEEEFSF